MKKYTVKPQYLDLFGSEAFEDTVITEEDVCWLAGEWEMTVEELLEQLDEADEQDDE